MKLNLLVLIVITGIIFHACATSKVQKEKKEAPAEKVRAEQELNIEVLKINTWINFMPGTEPRFNISGEIKIKPKDNEYKLTDLLFTEIKIKQNGSTVYFVKPTVREEGENKNYRKLLFSTIKGLSLTPDLKPDKTVDAELIFDNDGDELSYFVKGIKIEKVY